MINPPSLAIVSTNGRTRARKRKPERRRIECPKCGPVTHTIDVRAGAMQNDRGRLVRNSGKHASACVRCMANGEVTICTAFDE